MVGEDGPSSPHRLAGDHTLIGTQPHADKTLRQFSIRLFSNQLAGQIAAPVINPGHFKKLPGSPAKKLNQGVGSGPFPGFGRNSGHQLLEALIRSQANFRGNDRTASRNA